jgi:hypothetical protein
MRGEEGERPVEVRESWRRDCREAGEGGGVQGFGGGAVRCVADYGSGPEEEPDARPETPVTPPPMLHVLKRGSSAPDELGVIRR